MYDSQKANCCPTAAPCTMFIALELVEIRRVMMLPCLIAALQPTCHPRNRVLDCLTLYIYAVGTYVCIACINEGQ